MARGTESRVGSELALAAAVSGRLVARCFAVIASTDFSVADLHQIRETRSVEATGLARRNVADERTNRMKNTISSELFAPLANTEPARLPRFQIYHQTRTGAYTAEFKTDSAAEVVEAFLNHSPAFEGGELRIWNDREQRVSASVEWSMEKTDFGFPVFNRTNVFHDRLLGVIARQMQVREEIREEIQSSVRMSA